MPLDYDFIVKKYRKTTYSENDTIALFFRNLYYNILNKTKKEITGDVYYYRIFNLSIYFKLFCFYNFNITQIEICFINFMIA